MPNRFAEILKGSYVTRTSGYLDVAAKEELFMDISKMSGGTFTKSHNPGNVLSTLRITIPYKKWVIILTESDTRPLKFQIVFEPLRDYELIIGIEDFFDKILKRLDRTEIEVGDEVFDNRYSIHSNDPVLTRKLLNGSVRDKILKNNLYNISYLNDTKVKASELISVVSRTIDNQEVYLDLISLHQMLIDSLSESGVIVAFV